ncbi:MAG: tetratricopeptide repeat protein [Candidatus Scalindua rubra]|uniref:O-linked GlcNAc transferase n=1 Tax=Candidatus Scalindua brodae TaxID=237368 RepID=A0A0B0EH52_9BACT|nr:MAG: O-linked GlcNAc transferase [Candidatus Scalindua brodae]MBZ0109603.1 tetratricopeptide repeat protein [Candidatus Scalindua rubra]TWU33143.1 TPR repeat-containing protein YrrB [Candidatus Brocadiaceae bacterium S225]
MKILKKIILLVIVSFLFSYSCFAKTDEEHSPTDEKLSQTAEEHFERGDKFLARKLIPDAIVEFKKALSLLKEDQSKLKAEIFASLANAYNWKGTHKAAITACNKALEINPDIANAHYDLGFAYREEGNMELAEKEFALYKKLLKQEGEYIEIPEKSTSGDIEKLITVHQQKRAAGKAEDTSPKIDTFEGAKALDKMPNLPGTDKTTQNAAIEKLLRKGAAFYDEGKIDLAIGVFKEVLEIDSEEPEAYYNLGNAYADKEMFDEAIAMYRDAVAYNPEFVDAYLNLSTLYLDLELIDEAISLCRHAVNTNPNDAFLCFHLGEAYAMNLQYKEAITEYNKAMTINPMDPEIQYRLAESYYEIEQFNMALKHATQAEELGYITNPDFMVDLKKKAGIE